MAARATRTGPTGRPGGRAIRRISHPSAATAAATRGPIDRPTRSTSPHRTSRSWPPPTLHGVSTLQASQTGGQSPPPHDSRNIEASTRWKRSSATWSRSPKRPAIRTAPNCGWTVPACASSTSRRSRASSPTPASRSRHSTAAGSGNRWTRRAPRSSRSPGLGTSAEAEQRRLALWPGSGRARHQSNRGATMRQRLGSSGTGISFHNLC
jgi:hypothetical protein